MRSTFIAFAAMLVAAPLCAQPAPAAAPPGLNDLYVDFAVPDVPALGLFGLNPQKVSRPGNLKEFSLAVLPIAGSGTQIGSGAAFSWAPVYTFAHSLDEYRGPVLRRLSFSAATVKDSKTSAVKVGLGARVIVVDASDPALSHDYEQQAIGILATSDEPNLRPRRFLNDAATPLMVRIAERMASDRLKQGRIVTALLEAWNIQTPPTPLTGQAQFDAFRKKLTEVQQSEGLTPQPLDPGLETEVHVLTLLYVEAATGQPTAAQIQQRLTTRIQALRQRWLEQHWNEVVVGVDVGGLFVSPSGAWADLRGEQFGASLSAAFPLGSVGGPAQGVLQAQGRKGVGTAPTEDWFYSVGGRVLVGNATRRLSAEALWSKGRNIDPTFDGVTKRFTVGTEFRVTQGFWVEVAFGAEQTPGSQSGTSLVSLANLKYAFKSSPRFGQIPDAGN